MVPTVVSRYIRCNFSVYKQRVRLWQAALMRRAIALDQKLGDIEQAIHGAWANCFVIWPPSQQPVPSPITVDMSIEERERLDLASRYAAAMTRGHWR
ncbi:MAG: hypothetical protein ACJ789_06555 [Thermomicrobiales bacterium]